MELKPVATYTKCISAIFALLRLHDLEQTIFAAKNNKNNNMTVTIICADEMVFWSWQIWSDVHSLSERGQRPFPPFTLHYIGLTNPDQVEEHFKSRGQ